jgi:predicted nuclease of predicted toxin-antitoxin system
LRLLANENFPGDAVAALRQHGLNIAWVRTDAPGSSDQEILAWARIEDRILVTTDKDFGELAIRAKLPTSSGIILFRISTPSSAHVARVASSVLESREDWAGHFAVIEDARIRMIPLPSTS